MPWRVSKRGGRYCVVKIGESTPVPGGCHATRGEAVRHQRALYAGEAHSLLDAVQTTARKRKKGGMKMPAYSVEGGEVETDHVEIATIEDGDGNVVGFWSPQMNATITSGNGNATDATSFTWTLNGETVEPSELFSTFRLDAEAEASDEPTWEGVLAVEGLPTSDGRYLMPGKIGHRDLPLTLMAQKVTDEGHKGAEVAGKITEITRVPRPDLGEGAVAIMGRGVFADTDEGREAAQLLADDILRGVSIDFAATAAHMLDPETLEVVDGDDIELADLLGGKFIRGFEGDIMGATLCPFPAFEDATMQIVETPEKVVVACAFPVKKVLTASAAGIAPLKPPYDWFFTPETSGACPLTVTDDGRVYGHLALWNQCHRSTSMSCEMAPRSRSGYAYFHTGALTTEDGRKVSVGRITVGDGGHASVSPWLGTDGAVRHYDETGMVGAFVRATDGIYGIWLSGVVRSDCPAEKVRDMEANPPSGDWREEKGRLELCAALSVPVAGFPVPRYEAALVASGADERVVALVATGYTEPQVMSRAAQRRISALHMQARLFLANEWDDGFADISAKERRRAAGTGAALPDGSFPIRNCSDAANAIRAQGRADPGKRARVRAHIRTRVRALGCSGGIFDPYK